jgi:sugar lactone lactonase YvrE
VVDRALASGAALGEGPVWDTATNTLLWVDIDRATLYRFNPSDGTNAVLLALDRAISAVATRRNGGLVLAIREGLAVLDSAATLTVVADLNSGVPGIRMNDGMCDRRGRFFAGTMTLVEHQRGAATLVRLDPTGQVHVLLEALTLANGMGWSPDGCLFYLVDSAEGTITVYPFEESDGSLGKGRILIHVNPRDGAPDGLAVDQEGCLWVAMCGGSSVRRYAPDGRLVQQVQVPTPLVTNCAFGGPKLDRLFVTTAATGLSEKTVRNTGAGDLYVVEASVCGLAPNDFAG